MLLPRGRRQEQGTFSNSLALATVWETAGLRLAQGAQLLLPRLGKAVWTCTPKERFSAGPGLCHPDTTALGELEAFQKQKSGGLLQPRLFFSCNLILFYFFLVAWSVRELETQWENNPGQGYFSKQRCWSLPSTRFALAPKAASLQAGRRAEGQFFSWLELARFLLQPDTAFAVILLLARVILVLPATPSFWVLVFYVWWGSHITDRFSFWSLLNFFLHFYLFPTAQSRSGEPAQPSSW